MREDTPFGPVWIFPDFLPMRAAMHGARLELAWPDLEGFSAMHTGPPTGGGWVVRAPLAALEKAGLRTDSAAEHPVAEGTVWPPIHIPIPGEVPGKPEVPKGVVLAPWITPEQLYKQNKLRRDWEEAERSNRRFFLKAHPEWDHSMPDPTILGDR